jgi:MFS transporter, MHS family, alpha-ketoglutarate permease
VAERNIKPVKKMGNGMETMNRITRIRSLRAAATGNALEWFDWTLYGSFSYYLSINLFQGKDKVSALLTTLAVFAVGFVARPLGGWMFGTFGDRLGRKRTLFITMGLLFASGLAIALIPTYSYIGSAASFLLLICRLLQGLAHGGESGVSYTYVAEIAPPARRGLWSSAIFVSATIGVIAATALAGALSSLLGTDAMRSYGWRIGFACGAFLGLYVLVLRRNAAETEVFEASSTHLPQQQVPKLSAAGSWIVARNIVMCAAAGNAFYYTWVTFAPTLAISSKGMNASSAYLASLGAQVICLFWLPFCGWLSDRIGRKAITILFGIGVMLSTFPISKLLTSEPWTLFVAQTIGLCIWGLSSAVFPALVSEQLPTHARARGVGLVTSLSAAVFGGTAPYLNTWLSSIGLSWVYMAYMVALGLMSCVGALLIRETRGIDLSAIVDPTGEVEPTTSLRITGQS